jgi:hypothetical protein
MALPVRQSTDGYCPSLDKQALHNLTNLPDNSCPPPQHNLFMRTKRDTGKEKSVLMPFTLYVKCYQMQRKEENNGTRDNWKSP